MRRCVARRCPGPLLGAGLLAAFAFSPGIAGAQAPAPAAPAAAPTDFERARKLAEEAIRKSEEAQAVARDVSRAAEALKLADEARRLAEQAKRLIEAVRPGPAGQLAAPPPAPAATVAAQVPPPKAPPRPESLSFGFNYRVRGWVQGNFDLNRRTDGDNENAFIDHRPRFQIDAGYRPFDFRLLFEKGDSIREFRKVNPERETSVAEVWGTDTLLPTNVRWAYLQYTGPVVARAGRQLMELGHDIVLQGDMDTLRLDKAFPVPGVGSLTVGAAYSKFPFISGGTGTLNDTDLDAWMGTLDIRPFHLVKGLKLRPYAYKVVDLSRGTSTSRPLDINVDRDGNPNTTPRDGSLEPLWLGLAIDGRAGDFEYWVEGIKLTGPFNRNRDFDGHAVVAHASYKLESFTLQLSTGSGSGAGGRGATNEKGDFNDFLAAYVCKDRFHYGNLFSRDIGGGFGLLQSNLANVTFVRPRLDAAVAKDFAVGLSYTYVRTTERVYEGVGPQGLFGVPVSGKRTNDVGHDFGLDASYRVARPVAVFGRVGYFLPGDAYRLPGGRSADPAYEVMIGTEFNLSLKVF